MRESGREWEGVSRSNGSEWYGWRESLKIAYNLIINRDIAYFMKNNIECGERAVAFRHASGGVVYAMGGFQSILILLQFNYIFYYICILFYFFLLYFHCIIIKFLVLFDDMSVMGPTHSILTVGPIYKDIPRCLQLAIYHYLGLDSAVCPSPSYTPPLPLSPSPPLLHSLPPSSAAYNSPSITTWASTAPYASLSFSPDLFPSSPPSPPLSLPPSLSPSSPLPLSSSNNVCRVRN